VKFGYVRRWIFFVRADQVASDELRRGEDHVTRPVTARGSAVTIKGGDLNPIKIPISPSDRPSARNWVKVKGSSVELDVWLCALVKMIDEAAVAFRPRNQRL